MSINEEHVETATFAAGCFWGVEATFRKTPGVVDTHVGYCGGHTPEPSYEQVCTGMTGHAESVEVRFDPTMVSYEVLLDVFWNSHDPTQLNRQGPDTGSQYRSVIFYHNEEQKEAATASRGAHQQHLSSPIVTAIATASPFYPAEEHHQRYLEKQGRI
ncbi:MAG: peptide-methionine (S)-S-oxide reductase MsrA [Mariprofundaceae bacterium]|nr:peptide-methionine (S)-S-oxide reductase MsrA [Mariprofundaceae bacterium]